MGSKRIVDRVAPAPESVSSRSTQRPVSPAAQVLLALQRSAGNKATSAVLAHAVTPLGTGAPLRIQRRRNKLQPRVAVASQAEKDELKAFAKWLDKLVQQAHQELTSLQLANWRAANEPQIDTFLNDWDGYVAADVPAGAVVLLRPRFLKAHAGTAIEAYVCKVLMPTSGAPLTYHLQVGHGTTIVDVIAETSGPNPKEGWFDITSVEGHVLDKTSWLTRADTVAVEEIVYPALDIDQMYALHHAGVRATRARREQIEAARFIRSQEQRARITDQRQIKSLWQKYPTVPQFAAHLAVTRAQAKKVLYYGGIDQYPAGRHPRAPSAMA